MTRFCLERPKWFCVYSFFKIFFIVEEYQSKTDDSNAKANYFIQQKEIQYFFSKTYQYTVVYVCIRKPEHCLVKENVCIFRGCNTVQNISFLTRDQPLNGWFFPISRNVNIGISGKCQNHGKIATVRNRHHTTSFFTKIERTKQRRAATEVLPWNGLQHNCFDGRD